MADAAPKLLYAFTGGNGGAAPAGPLVELGGLLYGTARANGNGTDNGAGVVYSLDPATKAFKVVYTLPAGDDSGSALYPVPPLTVLNGRLYGTADGGPNGDGVVFEVNPAKGTGSVIYNFQGGTDGNLPETGLIEFNGLLYGTAELGGNGYGTIFSIDPATGVEKTVYSFPGGATAIEPASGLTIVNGLMYGTANGVGSGSCDCGVIYGFDPRSGAFQTLYAMGSAQDGNSPGTLTAANGLLFGANQEGGAGPCIEGISVTSAGCGTVFSYNPASGVFSVLYAFKGGKDGWDVYNPLSYLNGYLYGTTLFGGSKHCYETQGCGTAFRINVSTGAEQILYAFPRGLRDSANASIMAIKGKLYGTVATAKSAPHGEIFRLNP